ncbi:MAG: hypothetical protein N3A66_07680, partial [Planctomycetota bacterium]|nr:hypothetical protein [Planctomycetota bacterium]
MKRLMAGKTKGLRVCLPLIAGLSLLFFSPPGDSSLVGGESKSDARRLRAAALLEDAERLFRQA